MLQKFSYLFMLNDIVYCSAVTCVTILQTQCFLLAQIDLRYIFCCQQLIFLYVFFSGNDKEFGASGCDGIELIPRSPMKLVRIFHISLFSVTQHFFSFIILTWFSQFHVHVESLHYIVDSFFREGNLLFHLNFAVDLKLYQWSPFLTYIYFVFGWVSSQEWFSWSMVKGHSIYFTNFVLAHLQILKEVIYYTSNFGNSVKQSKTVSTNLNGPIIVL